MRIFILLFFLTISFHLFATHNRAGEITFVRTGDFTIEAKVVTYTKASSVPADRDSLEICWGDNNCEWAIRVNGPVDSNGIPQGELLDNDVKLNEYVTSHTYSSFGDYTISMNDPNRNAGISNLNAPISDSVPFHIQNEFSLLENHDDSPVFLEKPIDNGFVGQKFMHAPNAYDSDGDSLAYRLITPFQDTYVPVPNYQLLTDFGGEVTFDETTGLLIWDTPLLVGEYVVTIEVLSYRNGVQIGSVIRDMSFTIDALANVLPELAMTQYMPNELINVEVGQTIQFLVVCEDLENENGLDLTVTSGLFNSNFSQQPVFTIFFENEVVAEANFFWEVAEEHARAQPYQVVFKAADDFGLAKFVVLQFKVGVFTDVDFVADATPINLFPNPCDDYLYLETNDLAGQPYEIWNLVGKQVDVGQISGDGEIDVVGMKSGVYFVRFEGGVVAKFVKK